MTSASSFLSQHSHELVSCPDKPGLRFRYSVCLLRRGPLDGQTHLMISTLDLAQRKCMACTGPFQNGKPFLMFWPTVTITKHARKQFHLSQKRAVKNSVESRNGRPKLKDKSVKAKSVQRKDCYGSLVNPSLL